MINRILFSLFLCAFATISLAQVATVVDYTINENGQVELTVNSTEDNYYILQVRNNVSEEFDLSVSMTLGEENQTVITEALRNYPQAHYQVLEYSKSDPADTDNDGIDDITEYSNIPINNPLNAAEEVDEEDGAVILDSFGLFNAMSVSQPEVMWLEFLNGKRYSKFIITDFYDNPKVYFINGNKHGFHNDFIEHEDIDVDDGVFEKGQIIYHPTIISDNGKPGVIGFNFSDGHGEVFEVVQRTQELLAASMPFLENNISYYVTSNSMDEYEADSALFKDSRVSLLFEDDVFGDIDYLGLNTKEGYGFFREMTNQNEIPGIRDIVLYNSIPNSLPRVAGVITSVLQTPLSHANLRAIQDQIPNAFIRDPLAVDSIKRLLNKNIYFRAEPDRYVIREATQTEVDDWFESIRPENTLTPPLNLDFQSIRPLNEISFLMFDAFGAKCANIATMRTFGFPEGVIPDGFGIPFYFYQEFMKANNLFEIVEEMLEDEDFLNDRILREEMLADFRKRIKKSEIPNWMNKALTRMQKSFPEGTSIRCRSSTNNEDLPGFNGAGLYDSKTQHPEEGHISKSVKQVYASLWNLRAFDERQFYRVDHFVTSMGVLCHPNYTEEKVNGVGVSADPVYNTYNSFYYLNSQIGEDLVTNPLAESTPEEILLDKSSAASSDYILIRPSSLAEDNELVLSENYRDKLRGYLTTLHREFETLYKAQGNETFAMEIEYKVTSADQLIIKQARPWVSYESDLDLTKPTVSEFEFKVFPNPASEYLDVNCEECEITSLIIYDMLGNVVQRTFRAYRSDNNVRFPLTGIGAGMYIVVGVNVQGEIAFSGKFIKQ